MGKSQYQELSDEALAMRFREEQDRQALEELLGRYRKKILKKCLQYVKDNDTAEDLVQEVQIKIFHHLLKFRLEARFSTWLFVIVNNTCIDYLRKHKRHQFMALTKSIVEHMEAVDHVDTDHISADHLDQYLKQVTEEEKLLLVMKYREGISVKDLAQSLQLTESAVKMRLKRAREKILDFVKG